MKNPNGKPFFTYSGMVCHSGLDLRSVDFRSFRSLDINL